MKRNLLALSLVLSAAAFAADAPAPKLSERAEKAIKDGLPVCAGETTVSRSALQHKLPINLTAAVVRVESKRPICEGQWIVATSTEGGFYMGMPWFLDGVQGTIEEKLKAFTYNALKENFEIHVDRQKTRDGFFPVTMYQTTARGKLPLKGVVDPAGTVFLMGNFAPLTADIRTERLKWLDSYLKDAPTTGPADAKVTVVEFSDFECPSCMRAAGYLKPITSKYGDKVRYIRYDLPLVQGHPWALAAAIAGRAVHKQKPELFWAFKDQVYANQEKLNAFTVDDFLRNFAKDHELDMTKYDADVASDALKAHLLDSAGTALSNDVRATPTYMVNGVFVDPGDNGKALEAYVAALVK
jgi:protein-disulfide isomerase